MITFKQFLEEAFNTPLPYTHKKEGIYDNYYFQGYKASIRTDETSVSTVYSVSFNIEDDKTPKWKVHSPTGDKTTAETLQIYSTVIKIVDEFMSKHPVRKGDSVMFLAASNRTHKLYERYTKYLAHKYNMKAENTPEIGWFQLVKR